MQLKTVFLGIAWMGVFGVGLLLAQTDASVPRIHAFTSEDHGGGIQNWAITQDEAGRIYVANPVGVLCYDGVNWATLPLPGNPTVRSVLADKDRLYAGGYGEFGYFSLQDNGNTAWHSLTEQLSAEDRNEEIWNIQRLKDGRVLFQSFGKLFVLRGNDLQTISPPGVMMFAKAAGNTLIVPVTGAGLYRWSETEGFRFLPGSEALEQREVVGLTQIADGLLIATAEMIYILRNNTLSAWNAALNLRLKSREINRLLLLRDGTLVVGTITSGLFFFQPDTGTIHQISEDSGLSNNTVLALFESQWGNVWSGLDRGLDMVDRSRLIRYHVGSDRPPGAVHAAVELNGRAYVGTNQGLYWWDTDRQRYQLITATAGQVWELRVNGDDLLCGHNQGTFLIKDTTSQMISDRSGGWFSLPLTDQPGTLLQATYTGLQLIQKRDGVYGTHGINGLEVPIRYLSQTGEREFVALHGSRGGYRVRLSEDYRTILQLDTLSAANLIKASTADFGDTLLLQTQDAVYHYQEGVLLPLTTFRGVTLEAGNQCLIGRNTEEWFLYSKDRIGVFRGTKRITDLPLRLRFPFPVIIPWSKDDYLFLLERGYARVSVTAESRPVANMLLNVEVRRKSGWERLSLQDGMTTLAYGDNDLRFNYALPVYDRQLSYRSRLLGYSTEQWSEWSASGTRSFTSLPAGTYRLEVAANWFGALAHYDFEINPPWYRAKSAYLLYSISLLLVLYLLYRLHLQRLRTQARRLEVIRQRQLQQQKVLARNRELSANVRRKTEELANTSLALAKKNEMLLVLKEEIKKSKQQPGRSVDHQKMQHLIDRNLNNEEDWAIFESHFNEVHEAFLKRLRKAHPTLTTGDLRLSAYLRTGLSSKEIAPLLHISIRGVENKRYRLRKKLALRGGEELNTYLLDF